MSLPGFLRRRRLQLATALERLGWLLLPGHCVLCELASHRRRDICRDCEASLPWICLDDAVLELRGGRLSAGTKTTRCPAGRPHEQQPAVGAAPDLLVAAAFHYQAPLDGMLQRMKFHQGFLENRVLGTLLAHRIAQLYSTSDFSQIRARPRAQDVKQYAGQYADQNADQTQRAMPLGELPQVIMPIPLSRARLIKRGYNQAGILADRVSRVLGIPVDYASLTRTRHTRAQSSLSRDERQRNLAAAFQVHPGGVWYRPGAPGPPWRSVALVDDVMTTGATLANASLALQRVGVERVHCWVLAQTDLKEALPNSSRAKARPGL